MKTWRKRMADVAPSGWPAHVHPVIQRIYAARGVTTPDGAEHRLARLHSPTLLGGMDRAVELLIEAIDRDQRIVIAGDYDCDGATGAAVAQRGMRLLGAKHVSHVVPNRFVHGYGLSEALVASLEPTPDLIVTVDNGVASVAGVAAAHARGIRVLITDHHLPGDTLPAADAMVNPNLDGDGFPSKALAGVGVMFYLLLAVRAAMRDAGRFAEGNEPDLGALLDLVALGTVADLVPLDFNNRVFVDAGLKRMRAGKACAGITALIEASNRSVSTVTATDLAFAIGPRLNAAGRLEDMSLGVACLLTDDTGVARRYAEQLSAINQERREMQAGMVEEAEAMVSRAAHVDAVGVALFDPGWHAGIVGLVASKLKEKLHRPVLAFAPAGDDTDELRGSARSIPGFHIRDALAEIDAKHPGLILRFGGHAMAAGLSMQASAFERFAAIFDATARAHLDDDRLQAVVQTDGELDYRDHTLDLAKQLRFAGPWGQAFPSPVFENVFECASWKPMGTKHLRFQLRHEQGGAPLDAVMFSCYDGTPPPQRFRAAYELTVNDWQGRESVRLLITHMEPM
ncbi:single-stranded-DNA-specific exonuclease RecJ [Luteibacter aegosomatissinici]|uniref:single-stranded-DNA-specific exonuclease RecJ n=1 Tax=Luteibacter aegosomatissinici TaxID=2911539 RepID=UPI001FF8B690|nr:single-stranded-DNA-specific exonuclease RecJ [Luteibacter aegosomatissinici]UPG95992.1 single-stranded-DNA-specific exonuclease RecJ [Luteibacter aegosomatissinici]